MKHKKMKTLHELYSWVEEAHRSSCASIFGDAHHDEYYDTAPCDCGQQAALDCILELISKHQTQDDG